MGEIIDDQGNIPKPGQLEKIVEDYISKYYPGGTGSGTNQPGVPGSGPATCLTTGNWVELGPRKLSGNRTSQPNGLGRINSLAFHPNDSNIIMAGAPAGGLWITKDRGATWTSNTDTLPTLGVSSIVIDPFDPDTIYLGTGDRDAGDSYGLGILRSVDGGQTWSAAKTGMGDRIVGRLIADPNNKGVLLAATNAGIYRSTNHGNNWTRVATGNFKEIVMNPHNSNYIYAATYSTARYYLSTNNGTSFTQVTSGLPTGKRRMVIGVTEDDSNFVYVLVTNQRTYEGIYLSTDKGSNFTRMSNTPNIMDYSANGSGTSGQAWYDLDVAVDPKDKASIYVGGVNIFKSTDSGKTWKINAHWVGSGGAPAIHADQHVLEFDPNGNRLYVGNDGGVYYTQNGGSSYIDISEGIGNAQIYRLGQNAKNKNEIINGYQDNGTGMYENGDWFTIMGGDGMDCVIDPSDDTWAYSDLYYGDVRRFRNGRYNARIARQGVNGITESGGWVTPFILQEGTPKTMFIGYKNIWRTTNAQASPPTWTRISNNVAGSNSQNITCLENSPKDPKILYVARSGNRFFKTTSVNAGTPTWTNLTANLPNNAAVYWIESHHKKANTVWISQSNKVYQSDDGGSTWTNISTGLPNLRILSIVFDSSSKREGMYAGTYMGVFYRDTVLKKWIWFNNNMPTYTRVRDIEIYYDPAGRSQSHVVCATYGRGNWRSPLYDEDQKAPVAGFTVSDTFGCVGNMFQFTDTSQNLPTRWKWEIRPANVTYYNGTDSCSQFPSLSFNGAGKYSVKLVSENCIDKDSVEKNLLIRIEEGPKPAQCDGVTTSTSGKLGIHLVEIDTFKNASLEKAAEGAFMDFSCTHTIYLKTDTTYDMTITTGPTYVEHAKVFIDFNDNGRLDDAGEWVGASTRAKVHNKKIIIPANAVTGRKLRMRIMSDWDTIPANPCDTLRYGQTEDYSVVLEYREPVPDFFVDKDSVCIGETVQISDSSEGSITARKWYFGPDADIDSATGSGPHVVSFSTPGFKTIRLVVNNGAKEMKKDSVVFVKPTPNLGISLAAGTLTGCEGRQIELSATDSNQAIGTYNWLMDGITRKSNSDTFFHLTNTLVIEAGSYRVAAAYQNCVDTSDVIQIEIDPNPSAGFTVNTDSQCFDNHQFDLTGIGSVSAGTFTTSWSFGDASSSAVTSPSKIYAADGLYTIKQVLTSDKGCKDSLTADVRVWPEPNSAFSVDEMRKCFNGHEFTLTNSSNISTGSLTYSWDFGDLNTSTSSDPKKKYATHGVYDIELIAISDNGCRDTSTAHVTVDPTPFASFTINDDVQCFNSQSFDFTNASTIATGSIGSYSWDLGDGNSRSLTDVMGYSYVTFGAYDVVLTAESDQGCKDDTTIRVSIGESPTPWYNMATPSNCFNEHNVSFTQLSTVTTGSITSYFWRFSDGTTFNGPAPPDKKFPTDGMFRIDLIVETDLGCVDSTEKNITFYPSPLADFLVGNVCQGEAITIGDQSSLSAGSLQYLYDFGTGETSTVPNPTYTYADAGLKTIVLTVTSDRSCKDTIQKDIVVHDKPQAQFTHTKTGSFGTTTEIQFTNQSTADVVGWDWDFQSGGNSTDEHPLIQFIDTGSFNIRLIVENANGCRDTIAHSVFVFPETVFHVPNSFSPNNDQLNDLFEIQGLEFAEDFSLKIYTRWGQKVFDSDNPNLKWDGTYQHEELPSGMYVYTLEFKDLAQLKYKQQGNVFLVR